MALDPQMEKALNKQVNQEMGAAYAYLAMTAYFESENLKGFAAWTKRQRAEELVHADRVFTYVLERGSKIQLAAVAKPKMAFKDTVEVFQTAYDLECANTKVIHQAYALAVKLKDYASQSHLQWFIDEQVEEESTTSEILSLVTYAAKDPSAMLVLNQQFLSGGGPGGPGGE